MLITVQAIKWMRENNKHMVIDADGLYIVTKNLELVRGYRNVVLTPNKGEFSRLAKELDVNIDDKDRYDQQLRWRPLKAAVIAVMHPAMLPSIALNVLPQLLFPYSNASVGSL